MAAFLWFGFQALHPWMTRGTSEGLIGLMGLVAGGGAAFALLAFLTGAVDRGDLARLRPGRRAA